MSLAAGFDIFDVVSGFLISEGIAEDINEAAWLMANEITEEQIDEIMGLFGKKKEEPPLNPAGRSMTSTPKKLPYKVDTRRPEISVTTYGKGGRSETFKTRGPVR
jgi:formate dehydrogenase assembly factor FdhD